MAASLPALIAAASAEGGGGGGLADINFGLTLWTIVLFILFAAVLTKFGWGPLLRAIEDRERASATPSTALRNEQRRQALSSSTARPAAGPRRRDEMIKQAMATPSMRTELMAQAKAAFRSARPAREGVRSGASGPPSIRSAAVAASLPPLRLRRRCPSLAGPEAGHGLHQVGRCSSSTPEPRRIERRHAE
jgi:hypothetical protein